jgi:hypothetical protein
MNWSKCPLSELSGDSFVTSLASAPSEPRQVPTFDCLKKLQDIETSAKAELALFGPKYQSQLSGFSTGSKRKGMVHIDANKANTDND